MLRRHAVGLHRHFQRHIARHARRDYSSSRGIPDVAFIEAAATLADQVATAYLLTEHALTIRSEFAVTIARGQRY